MDKTEARTAMSLAIGRFLRLMSRPEQPGDIEQFELVRKTVAEASEVLGIDTSPSSITSKPLPGWNFGNGTSGSVD